LLAQGYSQWFGVEYDETFAPVAKMTIVRTLLVVAAMKQWCITQMEVSNAFLHGDLGRRSVHDISLRLYRIW